MWVFGYGSLMWRPGFDFEEQCQARLHGYHRALCVLSLMHRGTPEQPGLVFGLDAGGACRGMAFRVAGDKAASVRDYLREREQITMVYREILHPVVLLNRRGRSAERREGWTEKVESMCYIVNRTHDQYAGRPDFESRRRMITDAVGRSGSNRDYLENTVRHLTDMGIVDRDLIRLWHSVERVPRSRRHNR